MVGLDLTRWSELRSRGIEVDFPFFLAPMVGLSHVALRCLVRSYLPEGASTLLFTEMLSSRRLPTERIGDRPETAVAPEEADLAPQLLGNEERFIEASLRRLRDARPRAIDINMGCPVSHALKHNWGVALMGDPAYAEQVVRMTVRHSPWPVSVKIRTGLHDDLEYLLDFVRMLEEAGASWVTLHPRTADQQRRGSSRWDYIAYARDAVRIPVIGNGDAQTADDACAMMAETGCDGVMIGRAAVARPWLFWQLGERYGLQPPLGRLGDPPSSIFHEGEEFHRSLVKFMELSFRWFSAADAQRRIRFFLYWGSRWLDFGHELWRRFQSVSDLEAGIRTADQFFSQPQRMSSRTALRG